MQEKEERERPFKWFILPNESYKWDFILEKFVGENSHEEVVPDSVSTKQQMDVSFDNDIITQKKRKRRDSYYY